MRINSNFRPSPHFGQGSGGHGGWTWLVLHPLLQCQSPLSPVKRGERPGWHPWRPRSQKDRKSPFQVLAPVLPPAHGLVSLLPLPLYPCSRLFPPPYTSALISLCPSLYPSSPISFCTVSLCPQIFPLRSFSAPPPLCLSTPISLCPISLCPVTLHACIPLPTCIPAPSALPQYALYVLILKCLLPPHQLLSVNGRILCALGKPSWELGDGPVWYVPALSLHRPLDAPFCALLPGPLQPLGWVSELLILWENLPTHALSPLDSDLSGQ